VVIGDPRPKNDAGSTPTRKVVMEKLPDGEETTTITIKGSTRAATRRRLKDHLWLVKTKSGSRPLLTRGRRSDHHGGPKPVTRRCGQTTPYQGRTPQMVKS
jgi:hypothetical protein